MLKGRGRPQIQIQVNILLTENKNTNSKHHCSSSLKRITFPCHKIELLEYREKQTGHTGESSPTTTENLETLLWLQKWDVKPTATHFHVRHYRTSKTTVLYPAFPLDLLANCCSISVRKLNSFQCRRRGHLKLQWYLLLHQERYKETKHAKILGGKGLPYGFETVLEYVFFS